MASTPTDTKALVVGFVGTGTMGGPMAQQVLQGGHELRVHDQSDAATSALVQAGAVDCATAAASADGADMVMLSLPSPAAVADAVAGPDGVLDAERLPTYVVDLSTNGPDTVAELGRRCAAAGATFVDAPVSGGVAKARNGSLAVMVGADTEVFDAVRPVLGCVGDDIISVGPLGSGTIAKIVNNQLFLAAGVLVQEAYVLGQALGMDPSALHRVISASSGGPYAKLAPLLLGRQFDDVIFRLDIAAKDLELAVSSAHAAGAQVPLTEGAVDIYTGALSAGDGEVAFHATLRELERRAGVKLEVLRRPPRPDKGSPDKGGAR